MTEIYFKKESYLIVGACMKVHTSLGPGFLEAVYQEALEKEFTLQNIPFERQKKLSVFYGGVKLKKYYVADFLCYDQIVVEIKALKFLSQPDYGQLKNSLKATNLQLGMLVNFGSPSLIYKRILNPSFKTTNTIIEKPSINLQKFASIRSLELAPVNEQEICLVCGFCCDATLFMHAVLQPGEKGNLPEKMEQNYYLEDGNEYFCFPCPYFEGKCAIYNQKRADVCGTFRCQLLKDFAAEKITRKAALEIIRQAIKTRDELVELYNHILGDTRKIPFMKLLQELGKMQKNLPAGEDLSPDQEMLIARCNILEAQLIRYFRSAAEFDNLIMKE
jgi:GxxExxY protein